MTETMSANDIALAISDAAAEVSSDLLSKARAQEAGSVSAIAMLAAGMAFNEFTAKLADKMIHGYLGTEQ